MRNKKAIARKVKGKSRAGDKRDEIQLPVQPAAPKAAYLTVTELSIKEALIEARGDIFVASQLLQITALRLNRAIQVCPALQGCIETTRELGPGVSKEALDAAVESRMSMYRVVGLDALHDLAAMPIDANSAQNQVKLAAAARLAGTVEGVGTGGLEETLRDLNKSYAENAPRLRIIRERVTVEQIPPERVVNDPD